MRARLIVTTIVMAGLALAVGAIALAGKPASRTPRSTPTSERWYRTTSTW